MTHDSWHMWLCNDAYIVVGKTLSHFFFLTNGTVSYWIWNAWVKMNHIETLLYSLQSTDTQFHAIYCSEAYSSGRFGMFGMFGMNPWWKPFIEPKIELKLVRHLSERVWFKMNDKNVQMLGIICSIKVQPVWLFQQFTKVFTIHRWTQY